MKKAERFSNIYLLIFCVIIGVAVISLTTACGNTDNYVGEWKEIESGFSDEPSDDTFVLNSDHTYERWFGDYHIYGTWEETDDGFNMTVQKSYEGSKRVDDGSGTATESYTLEEDGTATTKHGNVYEKTDSE